MARSRWNCWDLLYIITIKHHVYCLLYNCKLVCVSKTPSTDLPTPYSSSEFHCNLIQLSPNLISEVQNTGILLSSFLDYLVTLLLLALAHLVSVSRHHLTSVLYVHHTYDHFYVCLFLLFPDQQVPTSVGTWAAVVGTQSQGHPRTLSPLSHRKYTHSFKIP